MQSTSITKDTKLKVFWSITVLAGLLGALVGWGVMSGDQQGRVNLLYLLLVYLFFPVLSIIISCISLLHGRGFNLARLIVALPFLSGKKKHLIRKIQQFNVEKYWLFYQSQLAALSFSCASLLVFLILLLATDVNFVWRSTLLLASDLLPLLEFIAKPWYFWDGAQPNLALLQATQESRLSGFHNSGAENANWWQFVLAVQIFYCLILRSTLLLITRFVYVNHIAKDIESQLLVNTTQNKYTEFESEPLALILHQLSGNFCVTNWSAIELNLIEQLPEIKFSADNQLNAGPMVSEAQQRVAERWQGMQLLLVKAWEPPLGELRDYLDNGKGYILPLDWKAEKLVCLRVEHLQEWQRFIATLPNWQLYLPERLMPKE